VLLSRILRSVGRRPGSVLGDLLAVLDGLGCDVTHLLADLGRHRTDPLLLEPSPREQGASHEPNRRGADHKSDRIVLGHPDHLARAVLCARRSVARRAGHGVFG